MHRKGMIFGAALLALFLSAVGPQAAAQAPQGPLPPPPKHEVVRIPVETAPEPPSIPVAEIIQRFTQKEDEFQRARSRYAYHKTVRVQEFGEDGKPAGEFELLTELVVAADGKRYERIVQGPPSTLRRMTLAPEDVETLARTPAFVLPSDQIDKYEITYAGKQQVDELTTYVFRVKPRQRERKRAYFEGLVWVDDHDLVIVKTYGKWVTEVGDVSSPEFPFTTFETYRQPVDGKYWFPAYTRSDDFLTQKNRALHIRLTVRWSDYKPLAPQAPPGL